MLCGQWLPRLTVRVNEFEPSELVEPMSRVQFPLLGCDYNSMEILNGMIGRRFLLWFSSPRAVSGTCRSEVRTSREISQVWEHDDIDSMQ